MSASAAALASAGAFANDGLSFLPVSPDEIRMLRITLLYALFILAVVLLADSGHLPRAAQSIHDLPHADKVIHFSIFGTLALCLNLALASRRRWSLTRAIVTGSILVAAASTLDETTNLLVAYRSWSLGDLTANYLGVVCLGVVPMLGWRRTRSPAV
jgi:polysaccharide biosynthesis protein VpsQ